MGFVSTSTGSSEKIQFENRLKKCNLKCSVFSKHTTWFLTPYLIIRSHEKTYTIHTNGDIDHFQVLEKNYGKVNYECSDYKFLLMLLMEATKETSKQLLNGK